MDYGFERLTRVFFLKFFIVSFFDIYLIWDWVFFISIGFFSDIKNDTGYFRFYSQS